MAKTPTFNPAEIAKINSFLSSLPNSKTCKECGSSASFEYVKHSPSYLPKGDTVAIMLDIPFIAAACTHCGFTRLFRSDIVGV